MWGKVQKENKHIFTVSEIHKPGAVAHASEFQHQEARGGSEFKASMKSGCCF